MDNVCRPRVGSWTLGLLLWQVASVHRVARPECVVTPLKGGLSVTHLTKNRAACVLSRWDMKRLLFGVVPVALVVSRLVWGCDNKFGFQNGRFGCDTYLTYRVISQVVLLVCFDPIGCIRHGQCRVEGVCSTVHNVMAQAVFSCSADTSN